MTQITIGADPELFVFSELTKKFVSAHDIFPGTKELPEPVEGGAIQVDGVAFEFNINPASSFSEFSGNIRKVLSISRGILESHNDKYRLFSTSTATFDRGYFDALPDHTKALGCEPDFNAYTGQENPKPTTTEPFRTGSGHIHVGWGNGFDKEDPEHRLLCEKLVMQMDACLYFASLLWDHDRKRRTLYGKIGAYRPKSYGVEYRVLSNSWVEKTLLQDFVFGATKRAADLLINDDIFLPKDKEVKQMIDAALAGRDISRSAIQDYTDSLTSDYAVPSVPFEYGGKV